MGRLLDSGYYCFDIKLPAKVRGERGCGNFHCLWNSVNDSCTFLIFASCFSNLLICWIRNVGMVFQSSNIRYMIIQVSEYLCHTEIRRGVSFSKLLDNDCRWRAYKVHYRNARLTVTYSCHLCVCYRCSSFHFPILCAFVFVKYRLVKICMPFRSVKLSWTCFC